MTTITREREKIEPINVDKLRADHPLLAYVAADVNLTEHKTGFHFGPCPFCREGDDRFKVFFNDGQQLFYCRRCDRQGDVIKYVMDRRGLQFVEACRWLDASSVPVLPATSRETAAKTALKGDQLQDWRNQLEVMATEAMRHLLTSDTDETRAALTWLGNRGITREIIALHGIGFNDKWRQIILGHKLPPGITIPRWRAGDVELTAVSVYLNKEAREYTGNKRMYCKGSKPKAGFWNGFRTPEAHTVFILEGELDAALMGPYLPSHEFVAVATGGADLIPDYLSVLDGKRVIVVPDNDDGGESMARRWREALPTVAVAWLPDCNDLTEYWQHGGDLAGWVREVIG
jgi:DNA primase